jgi:hypothetical protein
MDVHFPFAMKNEINSTYTNPASPSSIDLLISGTDVATVAGQ